MWLNYSQPNGPCEVRTLLPNVTADSILHGTAPYPNSFQKCEAWDFDTTESVTTIITEWNLICDREGLVSLADSLFLVGVGIGGVVGGWISDKLVFFKLFFLFLVNFFKIKLY